MILDKHLEHTGRITYEDLDWAEARRSGLTEDEVFILTYFSDIEGQTVVYMKHILNTSGSLDPEVMSFLTIWNYEEFFHGHALSKLLRECGHPLGGNRIAEVRRNSLIAETLKPLGARLFSLLWPEAFITLFMAWGALNEITTLRGYEAIEAQTRNPVLAELCRRITKQERRHFAWYFNNAEARLKKHASLRRIVRNALRFAWSPVGAGVKPDQDVIRIYNLLFPERIGKCTAEEIDSKINSLPGLGNLPLMRRFASKAHTKATGFRLAAGPHPI